MRVCQHQASSVLLKPKHNREAFANLDMLEGEEGVGGRQAVRALLLCRAQAGQEAVHEEQSTAPGENGNTLSLRVGNSGDLDSEGNSRKAQDTICMLSVGCS